VKQGLLLSRIVLSSGRELIGAVCDYLAVGRGAAVGFAWLGVNVLVYLGSEEIAVEEFE
jgi:hypothetical protein